MYMEQMVYHYTSIEAFQKMIENISHDGENHFLTFWATSIYAMNDPSEFLQGYKLLKESVIPDIEREMNITDKTLRLSYIWRKVIGRTSSGEDKDYMIRHIYDTHENPFIISFSKRKDFLPMWNAYSNRGKGVCLCFNNKGYVIKTNDRANIDVDFFHKLHAMDVTYGKIDNDVKNVATSLYKEYYLKYKDISDLQQRIQMMLNYLITLIVTFSAYHKHEAYEYEEESRLVKFRDGEKEVHYRIGHKGQLIPYIEVKVKLEYLEKIIVGPCADSESIIRELKHQLSKYNITDIKPSSIPYREI